MMKETELKPCPFCGGQVRAYFTDYLNLNQRTYHLNCNKCNTYFALKENSRYVSAETTEKELIEAWNRRADNEQRETLDTPTNTPTQNQFTNSELKELARAMCDVCRTTDDNQCEDMHCEGVMKHAEKLYKQGIRKQSIGEWLVGGKCTNCNEYSHIHTKFCPNCGARMKGGAE